MNAAGTAATRGIADRATAPTATERQTRTRLERLELRPTSR